MELSEAVYAMDATTIELYLARFSWASFRVTQTDVKLHTLLDLRGAIPAFIRISDGKLHDANVLDLLIPESDGLNVISRGSLDFERRYRPQQAGSFFVILAKSSFKYNGRYS